MRHILFLLSLFVIAVQLKGQNYEIVRKTNKCKIISEWTDIIPKSESYNLIAYNIEFSASEQKDCGNIVLTITIFNSTNEKHPYYNKIMNVKLTWKDTGGNYDRDKCRYYYLNLIYDSWVYQTEFVKDGNIISDVNGDIEIKEIKPHKYRLQSYTRQGSLMEGTMGKVIVYSYQYQ